MNQPAFSLKDTKRVFGKDLLNLQGMPTLGGVEHKTQHQHSVSLPGDDKWCLKKNLPDRLLPNGPALASDQLYQAQLRQMVMQLDPVDQAGLQDPQRVALYSKEITNYCLGQEEVYRVDPEYMVKVQTDINDKMRVILIDWLVDVQVKFKLLNETLHLTVQLIDRYLQKVAVTRQQLQLVGVSAMFIACKYEEIYCPELKDFVYVTDNAYNKHQILDMEGNILTALDFRLSSTSSLRFYERLQQFWGQYNNKMDYLARYVLELALVDVKFHRYSPSVVASATVYLVNKLFKNTQHTWPSAMEQCTQLTEQQIRPCAKVLCVMLQALDSTKFSGQNAVLRKYQHTKYLSISNIRIEKTN